MQKSGEMRKEPSASPSKTKSIIKTKVSEIANSVMAAQNGSKEISGVG